MVAPPPFPSLTWFWPPGSAELPHVQMMQNRRLLGYGKGGEEEEEAASFSVLDEIREQQRRRLSLDCLASHDWFMQTC